MVRVARIAGAARLASAPSPRASPRRRRRVVRVAPTALASRSSAAALTDRQLLRATAAPQTLRRLRLRNYGGAPDETDMPANQHLRPKTAARPCTRGRTRMCSSALPAALSAASLNKLCSALPGIKHSGPPGGGPALVAQTGRVPGFGAREAARPSSMAIRLDCRRFEFSLYSPSQPHRGDQAGSGCSAHAVRDSTVVGSRRVRFDAAHGRISLLTGCDGSAGPSGGQRTGWQRSR